MLIVEETETIKELNEIYGFQEDNVSDIKAWLREYGSDTDMLSDNFEAVFGSKEEMEKFIKRMNKKNEIIGYSLISFLGYMEDIKILLETILKDNNTTK